MKQRGNVNVCPVTKAAWEERAKAKSGDCGGQSVYHCLADNEGRKWERCVEKTLVKQGNCPIFASDGFIDWKQCNKSITTCPNESFLSDEVYKYSECFGNNTQKDLHNKTKDVNLNTADGITVEVVIGIVFCILAILAAALTFAIIYKRRKRSSPDSQEELHELRRLISGKNAKEIVQENNVFNGIAMLSKKEVKSIVVLGKFGSSVSSTSRSISEKLLKTSKDRMNWNSLECRYTDIPNTVAENTIIYVYGWFGIWNDDLCSVDRVKVACQSLIRILNETNNVKLIVGMRSDLYRKYHANLEEELGDQSLSLFYHEIYLDSADVRKDAEYLRFFNDKIKKPCKKDNCACKQLTYEMLRNGKDKVIGMPLKIIIIEKYHDVIPRYLDNWDILKVMTYHFDSIENDRERRHIYEWIIYFCLRGKFTRSEPFDTNLVKEMGFKINESSFDENDTELCRYVRIRNSDKQKNVQTVNTQFVFWHPFIYICAFHFLFNKDPKLVMTHCNENAILQLVRPEQAKVSYFEVTADDHSVAIFNERLRKLGKIEEYAGHPLIKLSTGATNTSQ